MPQITRHSPYCRKAKLVQIEPSLMAGNAIAMWTGHDVEGQNFDVMDTDLRDRGVALQTEQNGAGIYSLADADAPALQYEIDWDEETVELSDGTTMSIDDFRRSTLRVTAENRVICSMAAPLHDQLQKCKQAGTGAFAHSMDLGQLAAYDRRNGLTSETGMYDIIISEITDKMTDTEAMLAMGAPTERLELIDVMETLGVPSQAWMRVAHLPEFGIEQVRAMFRNYMERYVEDMPIEKVSRIATEDPTVLVAAFDSAADLIAIDEPFDGGNIILGYQTSQVRHYRLGNTEAIVFSDMAGSYAYAWPATPDHTPQPGF